MDDTNISKDDLKKILSYGLSIQSVSVLVEFCAKHEKKEFLQGLNALVTSLMASLTDEEKQLLQKDIDAMIERKAQEFADELGENLTPEEADKFVQDLQS